MSEAVLELRNVSKVFRSGAFTRRQETVAVDGISLRFDDDKPISIGIVGESGSGKSTFGRLMLGFIDPSSGTVDFRGKDATTLGRGDRSLFRREVQGIFQDPFDAYNPFYRVDHVLRMPLYRFRLSRSREDQRERIGRSLETVGLRPDEVLGRYPHQLSGGQLQRVMVARALLTDPKVLVADEPVSMVDASLRATILGSLMQVHRSLGISIVYITHDLTTAYHVADLVMVLYQGQVVEAGTAQEVILNPRHPYTRLLVDSIPWPDPARSWGTLPVTRPARSPVSSVGCKFAPRCPVVMERCRTQRPLLYLSKGETAARCFLFESEAVVESEQVQDRVGFSNVHELDANSD